MYSEYLKYCFNVTKLKGNYIMHICNSFLGEQILHFLSSGGDYWNHRIRTHCVIEENN